jgi:SSS family solute:Na+ symporter
MLFVFYQHHPDPQVIGFLANGKGDKVFPHFIATQLPSGLSGLLLAGLFAAAMSTLDSSMNALSTLIVTDLYRRFLRPSAPESRALSLARWLTFAWGALGIVLALAMIRVQTFLNFYFEVVAIIGGGIAGVFALALFSHRAHARGVLAGIAAGLLVTLWGSEQYAGVITNAYPWLKFPWDPIMVGVLTSVVVIGVGWAASRIILPASLSEKAPPVIWDTIGQ